MTDPLTEEEEDFVRWMDEVDLEEVNLLEQPGLQAPIADARESARLSGERELDAPKSRGVGWDEQP